MAVAACRSLDRPQRNASGLNQLAGHGAASHALHAWLRFIVVQCKNGNR
jgi:hypothetical protein